MSDAKRLRQLKAENSRLKRLLAEAHLDNAALKDLALRAVACGPLGVAHQKPAQAPSKRATG